MENKMHVICDMHTSSYTQHFNQPHHPLALQWRDHHSRIGTLLLGPFDCSLPMGPNVWREWVGVGDAVVMDCGGDGWVWKQFSGSIHGYSFWGEGRKIFVKDIYRCL